MDSFIEFLKETNAVAMIVPIMAMGIGMIAVVMSFRYRLRVKQWEMSLKHAMLERGMSAEEIKAVLEASGKTQFGKGSCGPSRGTGMRS
jgi:hypothetical protein